MEPAKQETTAQAPVGALLWPSLPIYQMYGANTDVGKTVFSTILCKSANRGDADVAYLKPVSTGPVDRADLGFAKRSNALRHVLKYAGGKVRGKTLFSYDLEVSPHIAAPASKRYVPPDAALLAGVREFASDCAASGVACLFVETAGGVHSPGPSGSTQADLYMPLRLPVVLIGDPKLGGISLTISAFESLRMRGYPVEMVLLFREETYRNHVYLADYFEGRYGIPVHTMPPPPPVGADEKELQQYYDEAGCSTEASKILEILAGRHKSRLTRLESMAKIARDKIWFPFTQHKSLVPEDVTVIDSAQGDYFQTAATQQPLSGGTPPMLLPTFDGSASWWTQGLGHGNPQLSLAAAYAAGRYGHVTFAKAVHEPGLALAERLLAGLKNPRLARAFYSDNGSTGMEVAVKMALRAACARYGWGVSRDVEVLGLRGSYHGDTIGVMDCSEPNVYNEKVEWYNARGLWLEYPTVKCVKGRWTVAIPREMGVAAAAEEIAFSSLSAVFDLDKRGKLRALYEAYLLDLFGEPRMRKRKIGALILEPVVLGAGGMVLVDPLFQRTLVDVVRSSAAVFGESNAASGIPEEDGRSWKGLPVIFDEVFTGLYRLGRFSAASFLGVDPDISVHAKLLTGGLVPLSVTLASESIFRAFESDDKSDALLHGHSYTAHPVGCQVALESLKAMERMDVGGEWQWAKDGWSGGGHEPPAFEAPAVWSLWSADFVAWLSKQRSKPSRRVSGAWALGSVLAVHLDTETGTAGYQSNAAAELQAALLQGDTLTDSPWRVHSRALGDVFYLMAGQTTKREDVARLERLLRKFFGN